MTSLTTREISLHGNRISYRTGGEGPLLVLIHGITSSSASWEPVLPALAERFTILAPDLLGHGQSDKPAGDYSLGSHACLVRDLMLMLGHTSGTIVGHSLGGGIAMQLAYQFPELVDRLVLVSSGGLGREVSLFLRAVDAARRRARAAADRLPPRRRRRRRHRAARSGCSACGAGSDLAEIARGIASLNEVGARRAFVHTARSVIDAGGQRVDARDRLYLAQAMPSLIVWGERDPIIPAAPRHPRPRADAGQPPRGVRRRGPLPPPRRAGALQRGCCGAFVRETEPAGIGLGDARELMLARAA